MSVELLGLGMTTATFNKAAPHDGLQYAPSIRIIDLMDAV